MLYFLHLLSSDWSLLNVFKYISFRTGGAFFTSFCLMLAFGEQFIQYLRLRQGKGQPIREDGPKGHLLSKKGTPSMGGVMVMLFVLVASILWANVLNYYVVVLLVFTLGFFAMGVADDLQKIRKQNAYKGLSARLRLLLGGLMAAGLSYSFYSYLGESPYAYVVNIPFMKAGVYVGLVMIIFHVFVVLGTANGVNLTDGLDGLAIVPVVMCCLVYGVFAYLSGNSVFAAYLRIDYIPNLGEIVVIVGAMIGALLGLLWFNSYPASIFMGDSGSLALGAFLGGLAIMTRQELLMLIAGGIFVVEALSSLLQVAYYKRTKKRLFLMAPIHHHFEQKGWPETKIVIRFWIISIILAILALISLKVR